MAEPRYHDNVGIIGNLLLYPRRVFIEALELGFSNPKFFVANEEGDPEEVENPYLYVKEGGDTSLDSKLEIADTWTEELNAKDPRPIILVRRQQLSFSDSSLGNLKRQDYPRGKWTSFADLVTVPLEFLCFARKDVESEELALVAGLFVKLFQRKHLHNTRLQKIGSPVIGTPTPVTTDSRVALFSTPVSFPVYMTLVWKFEELDLKEAKEFNISVAVKS